MRNWRHHHGKLINLGGRVVGIAFIGIGLIVGIYGLSSFLNKKTWSLGTWIMILIPFGVVFLGLLLLMAKPYRPNDLEEINKEDSAEK